MRGAAGRPVIGRRTYVERPKRLVSALGTVDSVTDRSGAGERTRAGATAPQPGAATARPTAEAIASSPHSRADDPDSLCAGQARAELEAVSAAVLAVTKHLSVREVLQTIVTAARSLLQAEYAALGVPDSTGSFEEFVVDGVSDEQWAAIGPLPRQHGLLGAMLRQARPQRLADITKDPRFVGDWPAAHPTLKDFLGMPVMDGEDILGAIYLANKSGGAGFTDADERMLSVLAAHAAIALTNARLYERSRELTIVEERQRIARELHDAVAQKLFSLRLTAQAAAMLAERDPPRAAAELATVQRLAAEASEELRQVVVELRPADLAGDGLAVVLGKQIDVLDRVGAASVRLVVDGWRRLPLDREEAVLRVAQEALHNAMRHAAASSINVRLGVADGLARLVVEDDGVGFDVSAATRGAHRLGLASMRERARAAGGRLAVRSRWGGGTAVTLEIPIP